MQTGMDDYEYQYELTHTQKVENTYMHSHVQTQCPFCKHKIQIENTQ